MNQPLGPAPDIESQRRRAGILCHPTSLPGPFGIGGLGESAYRFIDWLSTAGLSAWQVLPLGPTGYGDSPYQPFSAFAGNPLLIDLVDLVEKGLLHPDMLPLSEDCDSSFVDYGQVIQMKRKMLNEAYANRQRASGALREGFAQFRDEQASWLADYGLFMALKEQLGGGPWPEWPTSLVRRDPDALADQRAHLKEEIDYHVYAQFLFEEQWQRLHEYARKRGISIIGDLPIFVGHDSADVWSHQELFVLDEMGQPSVVAGVPPDYFSPTGQRWGNPLYRWTIMADDGYAWWVRRLRRTLELVDQVRIDHFRGFVNYWEVPASEPTATNGRWLPGPGRAFFDAIASALGTLPIIAEDLGMITPDVTELRQALGLPGMTVLQFAFDGEIANPHIPHNHVRRSVVYTGTHDNDTTCGWYQELSEREAHRVRVYTGSDGSDISWQLIRLAMSSVSDLAVFPVQDVLSLGSWARMNSPGKAQANWTWRFRRDDLSAELAAALADLAVVTGRTASDDRRASRG
ncbi:MAG: 4-alpha-glucanotransferase [Chloroflexi bacterium]|nr:4-alpha-glucanotransferase [Chloroflexota bacterium]